MPCLLIFLFCDGVFHPTPMPHLVWGRTLVSAITIVHIMLTSFWHQKSSFFRISHVFTDIPIRWWFVFIAFMLGLVLVGTWVGAITMGYVDFSSSCNLVSLESIMSSPVSGSCGGASSLCLVVPVLFNRNIWWVRYRPGNYCFWFLCLNYNEAINGELSDVLFCNGFLLSWNATA